MHNQDEALAREVIENDHKVNMMEVAIDEECVKIIAKRQPTASDLRLIMAISKPLLSWKESAMLQTKFAKLHWKNSLINISPC